jgi:hypothetical protein
LDFLWASEITILFSCLSKGNSCVYNIFPNSSNNLLIFLFSLALDSIYCILYSSESSLIKFLSKFYQSLNHIYSLLKL